MEISFKNKKVNIDCLLSFGFTKEKDIYTFKTPIADGEMLFVFTLFPDESCAYNVFDAENSDEYTLHTREDSAGSFIGMVRDDCDKIINRIKESCFTDNFFRQMQSSMVLSYILEKYSHRPDFPFGDESAILRCENGKWYGIIMTVKGKQIGLDDSETIEIINLKQLPEKIPALIDNNGIFPAYHMNKKHWITVKLDGTIRFSRLCEMIDESYSLVNKKQEKKK